VSFYKKYKIKDDKKKLLLYQKKKEVVTLFIKLHYEQKVLEYKKFNNF
jgi:hypothetical protein